MSDDELAEQLHRFAGYLDGTTPLTMSKERISTLVACHLKAIARSLKVKGSDRGAGFPPADEPAF